MILSPSTLRARAARRSGFTLLEVLIVVAILVVLAGIAGFSLFGAKDEADISIAKTKMAALTNKCVQYSVSNGQLPASLQDLTVQSPSGGRPYVTDPKELEDPWGKPFNYSAQATDQNLSNAGKPEISCTTPQGVTITNAPGQK